MLLRQSNNVVVVGTDVDLIILLSKRSHHSNTYLSNLVIFIVSFNRFNGFHNTSTLILKERHLN